MEYTYPLESNWNVDEICTVMKLYNCIEDAYEGGIQKNKLMNAYKEFKSVVDSKSLEKQISDAFYQESGYSIYLTMKKAKELEKDQAIVKMVVK